MNEELTSLLRHHDPAAGKSLSEADRARLLRNTLTTPPRTAPRGRLMIATAMLALAITTLVFVIRKRTLTPVQQVRPQVLTAQTTAPAVRQIQYATPGGTRIVWTLDPNFHM